VSLGSTAGLRAADDALAASIERAGASVTVARAAPPRSVRTLALTDYVWARAAREAAREGLRNAPGDVVIYSTMTAALLAPLPGAIRFDALAAAPLLIPWSAASLAGAPTDHAPAVVVPVAVGSSGPARPRWDRDIAAITYASDPRKKGLDRVLEAWGRVRQDGELLLVAGTDASPQAEGVRAVGRLAPRDYRALLRRARVFVTAPRREDYGIAQLEALADGCLLVTTPAPGPYVALELARSLDPRLVSDDLGAAIRVALDDPLPAYGAAAEHALERFSTDQVDYVVAQELLPRLFSAS
jgi:hypothetical protein